ncbi:hypothetical protein MNKW57_01550 [Biformimicrobium ophioploci]|uniref:Lipoprotein n=1 Tax=Biformimicrobium ophioploci TaxID=3036711 RepID=A0ABQ6LUS7_9GAMM|nr:hypothetical protein MNKW57_01550 [Microbulbifer sp. NKW57]
MRGAAPGILCLSPPYRDRPGLAQIFARGTLFNYPEYRTTQGVNAVRKLICILHIAALVTGVTACSTTATSAPEGDSRIPESITYNGHQFRCISQELETKTLVRCVRADLVGAAASGP